MITRREARDIVDWVVDEIRKRQFPYVTDGKLDFSKTTLGTVSGTQYSGGQLAAGGIFDRHVHPNADIQGTKVRIATTSERGTVQLGTEGEALVPTMSGLVSTASGLGASLIGVEDPLGYFIGTDVEAVLSELFAASGAADFLGLTDTPITYSGQAGKVVAVNEAEDSLEFVVQSGGGGGITEATALAYAVICSN